MKKLTYISLFSSAGVGCHGFNLEGFNCIATNELISRRLDIQRHNLKCKYDSGYVQGDILEKKVKDSISTEIELWRNKENCSEISAIIATPPCQGMSVANHKKKDEGTRNSLVVESIKIIKENNPMFFILENVRAFFTTLCTDLDGTDRTIKEAISLNLGNLYEIEFQILNFKNYGSNSSRTRSLVIGARKDLNIAPIELYPEYREEVTLKQVIGDLPSLQKMGEISKDDIYHSFRKYKPEMRRWIELLKEGQSAFDNEDHSRIPHYYKNGMKIFSKNGNGDKYTRQYWDKVAPCVHTRNDILASQATIHPDDDRVFSVRELMRMMTIPNDFKWSQYTLEELNSLSIKDKEKYISNHDINIRQSIGEAVPTEIFRQIAHNIKKAIDEK